MKSRYEEYSKRLFEILLGKNHHNEFLQLIDQLFEQGMTKKEIYNLFLDFHSEIQIDKRTSKNEEIYDRLSDFMDGFTNLCKGFKILPNEPDV